MKIKPTTEDGPILPQWDVADVEEAKEARPHPGETAFGCPRDFLGNRFVYVVVSARARGLSIGLNMNPDKCVQFRLRVLRGQTRMAAGGARTGHGRDGGRIGENPAAGPIGGNSQGGRLRGVEPATCCACAT